ncbi:hypothetical protein CI610_03541 [invertebrate metagenome]|uniref:Integrase catalytic domain-containing protein n=1 Tax=invertebrate metagenome TaxID=1711999 RepID=A0A2H9T2T0_9ZZZZ
MDDFNREALATEIDLGLPAARIIRVLERIIGQRGYSEKLRMDNGPEFISIALADWADKHDIHLKFIQPGTLTQNAYVERFNRTYRKEILNRHVFKTLNPVRQLTHDWIHQYHKPQREAS